MLIGDLFKKWSISPKGIIHIGAHRCEERDIYLHQAGCDDSKVLWIEGNKELYEDIKTNIPTVNIYNALIADQEKLVDFIVTNNDGMSSSFLELKEHLVQHPECQEQKRILGQKTTTLEKLVFDNSIDMSKYDFLCMDIQGCEYLALQGMQNLLKYFKGIYLEVNTAEIYKDCGQLPELTTFLEKNGFIMKDIQMTPHFWGDAYFAREKVFVQIGTNDGNDRFRKLVKEHVPDRVILVEPNPTLIDSIKKYYKDVPNVTIFDKAVFHKDDQEVSLYIPKVDPETKLAVNGHAYRHPNYSLRPMLDWGNELEEIKAKTVSFDTVCSGIKHIDYLQIDTEGFDHEIIKMIDFDKYTIENIRYEFWPYDGSCYEANSECNFMDDIRDILTKNNYTIESIDDEDGNDMIATKVHK